MTFLAKLNKLKCEASPIWGSDVIIAATTTTRSRPKEEKEEVVALNPPADEELEWSRPGLSYLHCLKACEPSTGRRNYDSLWTETDCLRRMIRKPEQCIEALRDIIDRSVAILFSPFRCAF